MSHITVVGNCTSDIEVKYTQSGRPRASFGVAENRSYTDRNGNKVEQTSFFNVVIWGDMAQNVANSVAKGTRIVVTGRLEQRSWETQEGDKRSTVEIIADEVAPSLRWAEADVRKIASNAGNGGGNGGGYARQNAPAPAAAPADNFGGGDDGIYEPF